MNGSFLSLKEKKKSLKNNTRALRGSLEVNVLVLHAPGSHMGAGSNPDIPAYHPAPCLWPGRAVEDGPKPCFSVPAWETQKMLLTPGFR